VSIVINDDASRIYVLDGVLGNIVSYKITDYGKLVLNAIFLNDTGDSEGSNACWQEVLKRNSNCEMAYVGLGKTFLSEGDYKKAMEYFKLGNSRKYYSKAFYYYRKEVMEKNFGKIMAVIILLVLALVAKKGYSRIKKWVGEVKCTTLKH
ncbi:MAG: gluconolactonase, partial [Lachnospiraceae bacterium]|nr:gluconolactonase [Lachnospiraceae bacterium]